MPKDQRTAEQAAAIAAHYRTLDAELDPADRRSVKPAADQAKNARAIGMQDLGLGPDQQPGVLVQSVVIVDDSLRESPPIWRTEVARAASRQVLPRALPFAACTSWPPFFPLV